MAYALVFYVPMELYLEPMAIVVRTLRILKGGLAIT
jgi:hypothetical protein